MDFRTCPACKASILEEDVDECPFCGAALSGKSGAKAAPAKPAASKPGATKPAASATPRPSATKPAAVKRTEPEEPDEEADPFEVDTSAVRHAHPVSPRRTKTTPMAVTCPMCETTGYISPKLANKEVKCCNPDCMVPIFKAPPLPKKEVPVDETPQGMSLGMKITYGVIGLLVLVGAGIGYVIITGGEDPGPTDPGLTTPIAQDSDGDDEPVENGDDQPEVAAGPAHSLDFILDRSVSEMGVLAHRNTGRTGTPHLGHQMTAEVEFILGNADDGRASLTKLHQVARNKVYYDVAPLAELAWHLFSQGDDGSANDVLDEAMTVAADLPEVGRQSLDDATLLGAALCRAERWNDALSLVRALKTDEPRGRLSALWRGALEFQTFDFAEEFERPYLMDMPDSLSIAITRSLCARGAWDQAWEWTNQVEGVDVQHNCQAAWAGALTIVSHRTGDAELLSRLDAAIEQADPVGQARMWTAVADGHSLFEKTSEAQAAIESALAVLSEVELPAPTEMPSMRAIHDSKRKPFAGLVNPAANRSLALAWADVGSVQAELGSDDAAWTAFASSLDALRGTTPSPSATQALVDECDNDDDRVKSRLAAAGVNDPNRTGFYQYRGQCEALDQQADARFQLQASLLTRAVDLGLVDQVWEHIKERGAASQPLDEHEPWYTSNVPGRIIVVGGRAANRTVIDDMRTTITPRPAASKLDDLHYHLEGMNAGTSTDDISDRITGLYSNASIDDYVVDARYLDAVARVYRSHGLDDAFELARAGWVARPEVVESALRLLGGLAIVSGQQDEMWDAFNDELGRLELTEKIAGYRGMIDGVTAARAHQPASEPADAAAAGE